LTVPSRCVECGGNVALQRGREVPWSYRKGGNLVQGFVPADIALAACTICGETYTSLEDALAIDRALGAGE
jgi:hypothetical protein